MRPQDHRVVVALVQRQPRNEFPSGLGLVPRRQKGGLPEARRAGDESEPAVRSASKTFQKALARDRLLAHRRRTQLRAHQDRLAPRPAALRRPRRSPAVQRCPGGPPALSDGATGPIPARCQATPAQGTWHLACLMRVPGSMGRKSLLSAESPCLGWPRSKSGLASEDPANIFTRDRCLFTSHPRSGWSNAGSSGCTKLGCLMPPGDSEEAADPLVACQMCSSAPGRWASWSSAWAIIGMPPWPTASGVRW